MSYHVIVLPQAEREFQAQYDWLAERSRTGAVSWSNAFFRALESLETSPLSCSLAPESDEWPEPIRQLIFKTRRGKRYRALFVVRGDCVYVLHLRGPAQDVMSPHDIRGLDDN